MVTVLIDNREIEAEEGVNLLRICLDNGIYVPNLCYLKEMSDPPASCRMCLVEIAGEDKPVAACTTEVRDGMVVKTDTPQVRRLQSTAFELLLSTHNVDCKNCPSNKKCDLQRLAKFLHISLKPKRLEHLDREIVKEEQPFLIYDPLKCILCGKCIFTCESLYPSPFLTFAKRGFGMFISFFGESDPAGLPCGECYACVEICPVSALLKKVDS
jgi:bidirectional [NiFe] hydrogenase diaphorase subunit